MIKSNYERNVVPGLLLTRNTPAPCCSPCSKRPSARAPEPALPSISSKTSGQFAPEALPPARGTRALRQLKMFRAPGSWRACLLRWCKQANVFARPGVRAAARAAERTRRVVATTR